MSAACVPGVAVVVLAGRGGARLARALASVEWAEERVVLDPAGRLDAEPLPPGVRRERGAEAAAAVSAPWLLFVQEDEVAPAALGAAVAAVVGAPSARAAYRVPLEMRAFGAALRPWRAPVRLARRPDVRLVLRPGLAVELRSPRGRPGRLAVPLLAGGASSLAEALDDLEADGAALAAMLRDRAVAPQLGRLALAPLAAAGRVLFARGVAGAPRARWFVTVFAGYRTMVAYAKLWELGQDEASGLR